MNVKILRAIIKRIECKLSNEWRKKCNTHLRSNIYEEYYKTLLKDIKGDLNKCKIQYVLDACVHAKLLSCV